MSRILKIGAGRDWCAANWAAEHLARLILQFLPPGASERLRQQLASIEVVGLDLDLSGSPPADMRQLLAASESAFAALTKAGPGSELFADGEFYAGFVNRFREFLETLRRDERVVPMPEVTAERFRQLDFHDDTLVEVRVLPAQQRGEASVVELQLQRGSETRRVLHFSGCANLRVAMDFDVLAGNLPPNTSRVEAHTDPDRMRSLVQSQEKDWDVTYAGTSLSPVARKVAALDELVCFRVQFFGGVVEVLARDYQLNPANAPQPQTPQKTIDRPEPAA